MPLRCKCSRLQPSWRPVRPALAAEPHHTHQLTASAKSTPTCRSGTRTGQDRPPPRFIDKSIAVRGGLFCQLWLSRNGSPSANDGVTINKYVQSIHSEIRTGYRIIVHFKQNVPSPNTTPNTTASPPKQTINKPKDTRAPSAEPHSTMDDPSHRPIELQSPEDLTYLIDNVRRAAADSINAAFPPVDNGLDGQEDELRNRIEQLVNDVRFPSSSSSFSPRPPPPLTTPPTPTPTLPPPNQTDAHSPPNSTSSKPSRSPRPT